MCMYVLYVYILMLIIHKVHYASYVIFVASEGKPELKDLFPFIVPKYTSKWKQLGTLLGLPMGKLDTIEYENRTRADDCCLAVLNEWLQGDHTASWDKVHRAVSLLAGHHGNDNNAPSMVPMVKTFLRSHYVEEAKRVKQSVSFRPSLQRKPGLSHQPLLLSKPKMQYTKLVFMLHESNELTKEDAVSVANVFYTGNITIGQLSSLNEQDSSYYHRCRKFTDIMNVLNTFGHHKPFLLILEGGPGMGKTTVCNEIANQWGSSKTDTYELVFLICLHLPNARKVNSFEALFEAVCPGNQTKLSGEMFEYLSHTGGKNVLVIIDGFNELDVSCSSFLLNIVYRNLLQLHLCDLVISSRHPEAAQLYHCSNGFRVEILGFSDEHKHHYIKQQVNKGADKLEKFIELHSFVESICYHPLLLTNVVSIFRASQLPSYETAIIDRLVCHIIMWYLQMEPPHQNLSIIMLCQELPLEHQLILQEISKCANIALQSGNSIFTIANLIQGDNKTNGLGFLRVFVLADGNKMFSFIHQHLQEFLISFYLTTLPSTECERFRKENMWSSKYLNVWFHYCGLVKGNENIITASLSGSWIGGLFGVKGTSEVLQDKMKCLYLLHCFMQSPENYIYQQVKPKVVTDENILDISNCRLTSEELEVLKLFLSRYSLKQWKCMDFSKCHLNNDRLIQILKLLQDLLKNRFCIDILNFTDNNIKLNPNILSVIVNTPNVQQCILSHNKIRDEDINGMILSLPKQFPKLNKDFLRAIQNHNTAFIFYANPLQYLNDGYLTTTLVELYIIRCQVNSETVDCFCSALKLHHSLSLLFLYDNKLLDPSLLKIADSLKVSNTLCSFLLYEKSLLDTCSDGLYRILSQVDSISKFMLVSTSTILAIQATSYQITLACTYINSVTNLQLKQCHITHEAMMEVATLLNSSPTTCDVLDLSGSRVDDSHLDALSNALHPEVVVSSLSLPASVSSMFIAELICCIHPSSVNISGSLTNSIMESVGMIVAENWFVSRRQSTLMLTGDNKKVGIFHKLDSSCIVANTSYLTHLFINECTVDGEVLANSLDNNESVMFLHLSNMKWDGEKFYTTDSFIKNKQITMSVCENTLPGIVKQNLLNAFHSNCNIPRIISTEDVFIAHSCSYKLVRWHLTQEASCDPLELFYMCNCAMTTDPEWYSVVEKYLERKSAISSLVLCENSAAKGRLEKLLLNTIKQIKVEKIFICENELNCNWVISLLLSVPSITVIGGNMFISVKGIVNNSLNHIPVSLKVIRMIECEYTTESLQILAKALSACTKLMEFTVSGGNLNRLQTPACATLLRVISTHKLLTHFSFNCIDISDEAVDYLESVIANNLHMEELRLNNIGLNSADVARICLPISNLVNLKVLSLTGNIMSETAATYLATGISKMSFLHSVCLASVDLQSNGAIAIANALTTIRTLKTLMLSNNKITEIASLNIAAAITNNSGLEKLYLDNNYLGTEEIKHIATALKHLNKLRHLHLKDNKFQNKAATTIAEVIANNSYLESVHLDSNHLLTKAVKEITHGFASQTQLKVLGVSNCGITNDAATYIANVIVKSPVFQKLQICDNSLRDEGCNIITNALKNITTLTKLYISNNGITELAADGIAEVIGNNLSLQVLDVGNNLLLTSGIIKIARALIKLHQVKELWLSYNYIADEAAHHIAAVITNNTKLEKLQLNNNALKTNGIHRICMALRTVSSLKVLLVGGNHITHHLADDLVSVIINNPFIEVLELGNNRLGTTGALKIASALCGVSHLKMLGLENNSISSEAADGIAAAITSNTGLEKLWLQNNRIESKAIEIISTALWQVNKLKLFRTENNNITADMIMLMPHKTFCSIEALCISKCSISSSDMLKVKDALQNFHQLKRLKLTDCHINDVAIENVGEAIAVTTKLENLSLNDNNLGDSAITNVSNAVKHINALRVLHLRNNNITESSASDVAVLIANNPLLECVHLGYNRLKAVGVNKLVYAFKKLYYLKELGLNNNYLEEKAANDISVMITDKTRLEKLWINGNRFKASGIKILCSSLKVHSALKVLQLENNDITPDAVDDITNILHNNHLLEDVYLGHNKLQTAGAIKITKVLKQMCYLKRLSLNDNQIAEEAAGDIAGVVTNNTAVEKLWLNDNPLNDNGMKIIMCALQRSKRKSLKLLQIGNNGITEEAIDSIATVISDNTLLDTLAVGNNRLSNTGDSTLIGALNGLCELKILSLNGTRTEESAAKDIAEVINTNPGLAKLYLNNINLKVVGVRQLRQNIKQQSSLKVLQLDNNDITEEAADDLASIICNNNFLEVLCLRNNKLNCKGITKLTPTLKRFCNLTIVDIAGNQITERAADAVAEVIVNNPGLEKLWLNNNCLKDRGTISIANALQKIERLKSLHLGNNNITEVAANAIGQVITNNLKLEELWLQENYLNNEGIEKVACALRNIKTLKLLHLADNNITEEADNIEEAITSNPLLEYVYFGGNRLGNRGAIKLSGALKRLNHLKILGFSDNDIDADAAKYIAEVINNNHGLEKLYLNGNRMRGVGVKLLCESIKQHSSFKLLQLDNNSITEEAADGLALTISNNELLEELHLRNNRLKTKGINRLTPVLKNLHCLKILDITGNQITEGAADGIADVIANNPGFEKLWLSNNCLEDKGIIRVACTLKKINTLRYIHIGNNNFTKLAANAISEVTTNSTRLEELLLYSSDLKDEGIVTIACTLQNVRTLRFLHLADNNITEVATDDMAEAIANNPLLEYVNLEDNKLGSRGVINLARGLKMLHQLKILDLSNNRIEVDTAKNIAEVVNSNPGLEKLYLSYNHLKGVGVKQLCEELKQHSNFKLLNLESNDIGEEAADSLASLINNNKLLQELYLGNNKLQTSGVDKITKALQTLNHVIALSIHNNQITEEAAGSIANILIQCRLKVLILHGNYFSTDAAVIVSNAINHHSTVDFLTFSSNDIFSTTEDNIKTAIISTTGLKFSSSGFCYLRVQSSKRLQRYFDGFNNNAAAASGKITASEAINDKISTCLKTANNIMQMSCIYTSASEASMTLKVLPSVTFLLLVKYPVFIAIIGDEIVNVMFSQSSQMEGLHNIDAFKSLTDLFVNISQMTKSDLHIISNFIRKTDKLQDLIIGNFNQNSTSSFADITNVRYVQMLSNLDSFPSEQLSLTDIAISLQAKSIVNLNISGCRIDIDAAQSLSVALSNFVNLSSLVLRGCALETDSLQIISSSLCTTTLENFDVSVNLITSAAIKDLIAVIENNKKLNTLYLDGNPLLKFSFTTEFAVLKELSVDKNVLDTMHLFKILSTSNALLHLECLIICDHSSNQKMILKLLDSLQYKRKVVLCKGINCIDNAVKRMSQRLDSLELVVYIRVSSESVFLSWEQNVFNDTDMKGIINNLSAIVNCCKSVYFCNFTDKQIVEKDAQIFTGLIANNSSLETICLSKDYRSPKILYDSSNFYEKVKPCIASPPALRQILHSLQQTVGENLKMVNLSGTFINEAAALLADVLSKCSLVEVLLLRHCGLQADNFRKLGHLLAKSCCLKILDLSHNNLTEKIFEYFSAIIINNRYLNELYLDNNCFHLSDDPLDTFWRAFSNVNLSVLAIDTNIITQQVLYQLTNFTSSCGIRQLLLTHSSLSNPLSLNLGIILNTSSLSLVKQNSCLGIWGEGKETTTIDCVGTDILGMLQLIGVFKNIKTLVLYTDDHYTEQEVDEIANALDNFTKLENICFHSMDSRGMLKILKALSEMKHLKEIEIFKCSIDIDATTSVVKVLNNNQTVNRLKLQLVKTSNIANIITSLQPRVLKVLDLTSNNIKSETADVIAYLIINNSSSLEEFYIEDNKLQADGMIKLLSSLKQACSLHMLSLDCNYITENISEHYTENISKHLA